MQAIEDIPELRALDSRRNLVRIPPETDVPLTPRVRHLLDTPELRRLTRISQLGLVSLVYPAAHHTRFEHSLGVYRLALLFLKHLAGDPRFARLVRPEDAELLIATALLHDVGHWPFCHPIEDLHLPGVPSHELFANSFILEGEIADVLRDEWHINPRDVVDLLGGKNADDPAARMLRSILSGPIDIDKMDYLFRDSLHAGVPYGRNFDQQRLIGSLCLNAAGDGLAITEKGKTAAELMVFARYVMFSEVYWHHAVRSATAMLQRAFYLVYRSLDLDRLFRLGEWEFVESIRQHAGDHGADELLGGLFGPRRSLYKRVRQFDVLENAELHRYFRGKSYDWLAAFGDNLAVLLSKRLRRVIAPQEILVDAPPPGREIQFKVDVFFLKTREYRSLHETSPVVRALADEQFDDYVKRVRIFAHPRIADAVRDLPDLDDCITETIARME
ncbi:HD domain-containing protein [Thermostilla marina]